MFFSILTASFSPLSFMVFSQLTLAVPFWLKNRMQVFDSSPLASVLELGSSSHLYLQSMSET